MNVATFMNLFPSFPETYVLWHISELVRSGQEVTLYAERVDRAPKKVQPEVAELDLVSLITSPPEQGKAKQERVLSTLHAMTRAAVRAPSELVQALGILSDSKGLGFSQVVRHLGWLDVPAKHDVAHAYFGMQGRRAQLLRDVGALKAPLVTSFLGFDLTLLPMKVPDDYYRRLFRRAERLTVSSEYMRMQLLALGAPEQKVDVLPLGLPLRRFKFEQRHYEEGQPIRLMTAARLSEIKGLEWGLRGVALAKARGVYVRWDIYGDGELRDQLFALRDELGLQEDVIFHGFQDMNVVREAISHAHLALFPGIRTDRGSEEALGGAVLEAQASGLPVIATDAGGIKEGFVPGKSGVLVPQRNAEAIADAIEELERRRDEWAVMGTIGREHVYENYDCARLNERWLELYKSL